MRHGMRRVGLAAMCAFAGAVAQPAAAQALAPVVTAIAPNNGSAAGGTSVTIAGSGFTAGSTVKFANAAAANVRILSPEAITVTSPAGSGGEPVNVSVSNSGGSSPATAKDQFAYDPAPAPSWLGLNGNSGGVSSERLREFAVHGIVYDRGGDPWLDWRAGELPLEDGKTSEGGRALATSTAAGMTPDIVIEYRAYQGDFQSDPDFPQERTKSEEAEGRETIKGYVAGFVKSAKAIHEKYPSAIFEPMNEPWGYTTPQFNAAQYASVIVSLLAEAKAAGLPLSSIYVAATGRDCVDEAGGRGAVNCTSNGWVPAMYAAQPLLAKEIQGWYLHPYGQPNGVGEGDGAGIQSVPLVQEAMTSGQNNIIVSEVGYCARNVNEGTNCPGGHRESAGKAARHLREMLENALPYHEAGWLRALLVYARSDGGWAMQLPDGALTAEGQALERFAESLQPAAPASAHRPASGHAGQFDVSAGELQLIEPI
jgi:hypothetical protein